MRNFFAILLLSAITFVACNSGNSGSTPTVKVTSATTMELGAEGGTEYIYFEIINPDGSKVGVFDNATWITTEVEDSKVVVSVEANNTMAEREAKITIRYFRTECVVTVKQAANEIGEFDVEFKAGRFEGIYFGTEYSTIPNYYIILSDIGANRDGSPKANGTYYIFDMYTNVASDENKVVILPNGTYTFDATDSYANGTFTDEGSWFAKLDGGGNYVDSKDIAQATVTVTDNKFEAIIEFTDGQKHYVTYEGELVVEVGYILSTYIDDIELDVKDATISVTYYGNDNEMNKHNWFIEATKGDEYFTVELLNDSATDYAGIYTALNDGNAESGNSFIPGFIGEDGLVGSWYATLTNGVIKGDKMAPMVDGVLQVLNNGDGTLTINYSCVDDAGNDVTGSVVGNVTLK